MRLRVLYAAALSAAALLAAGPTRADDDKKSDEKYTFKTTKFVPKGKAVKFDEKGAFATTTKVTDDGGNVLMNKKDSKSMLRVFVEKTLEADEKAEERTKYSRAYEKAKDVEGDESQKMPYQGRTVVFEKSKDKWTARAEGKPELGDKDLADLVKAANRDPNLEEFFHPKKAVKVGEKWEL